MELNLRRSVNCLVLERVGLNCVLVCFCFYAELLWTRAFNRDQLMWICNLFSSSSCVGQMAYPSPTPVSMPPKVGSPYKEPGSTNQVIRSTRTIMPQNRARRRCSAQ